MTADERRTRNRRALKLLLGVFVIGGIAQAATDSKPHSVASANEPTAAAPQRAPLAVTLGGLSWHMGGFGTVMIASFVIRNGESFAVKDIDIVCELTAESGTPIGYTGNTVFRAVPAHGQLAVSEFNMGSGITLDPRPGGRRCQIGKMSRA